MTAAAAKPRETPVPGRPYSARLVRRLRAKLRTVFADQYADAMEILDHAAGRKMAGALEPDWRSMFTPAKLKKWAEDVYPELADGYELGGAAGYDDIEAALSDHGLAGRVNISPWDVEAPGARDAINRAALDLSHEANGVTKSELNDLLPRLRSELIQGNVTGEGYDWMAEQIRTLFGHADAYRAQRIAITETQRAIHTGLLEQYQESGVVEATRWMLSGAPCDICIAIAEENDQGVALFAEYAKRGDNATYSVIQSPPAHPNCLCSVGPVLIPLERLEGMARSQSAASNMPKLSA